MIEDSFFSEPRQTHDFCGAMGGVGGARRAEERRGKGERGARPLPLVGVQGAGEGGAALRSNTGGSAGLGGGEEGGGGLVRGESKSPSSVFSASPPITPAPLAEFLSPRTRGRKNSSSSDGLEAAAAAAAAAVAAARGGGRKSEQGGGASSLWKLPQLRFESRFECGNLARAVRVGDGEYDLLVSSDLNTDGNTQWFYFAVTGMVEAVEDGEDGGAGGGDPPEYRFNVINNEKGDSMFNYGMQPLFYSPEVARRDGLGWLRLGHDICYYQNHFAKVREREEKNPTVKCYTASWAFTAKDTGHCGYVSISLLSE